MKSNGKTVSDCMMEVSLNQNNSSHTNYLDPVSWGDLATRIPQSDDEICIVKDSDEVQGRR